MTKAAQEGNSHSDGGSPVDKCVNSRSETNDDTSHTTDVTTAAGEKTGAEIPEKESPAKTSAALHSPPRAMKILTSAERDYWQRRMPPGFQFYLERMARAVIRNQPPNIADFAAVYLEELLVGRNGKSRDIRSWDKSGPDLYKMGQICESQKLQNLNVTHLFHFVPYGAVWTQI